MQPSADPGEAPVPEKRRNRTGGKALCSPSLMKTALFILSLTSSLATAAEAGVPVELPPGEDSGAWTEALEAARKLVPELEIGLAVGPGASVRLLEQELRWAVHIHTASGRRESLQLPAPQNSAARTEIMLVCAEVLTRTGRQIDAQDPPVEPVSPPPAREVRSWGAPSLAAGIGLPWGPTAITLLAEPPSFLMGNWQIGQIFSARLPVEILPGLDLSQLGILWGAWWVPGERVQLRLGAELGVSLHLLRAARGAVARDWGGVLAARGAADLPLGGRLLLEPGLRLETQPRLSVERGAERYETEFWRLQAYLAFRLRLEAGPDD